MTNFSYNRDIPDGPNNPSNDQPLMKTNTNSTDDLINEDHYSFGVNNGGLHKQVRMPILAAIPGGLIASEGTLYTKSVSAFTQLFYTPDASTNEYQLTRTGTAAFPQFGKYIPYTSGLAGATTEGGWTFLAGNGTDGGMILQYGTVTFTVPKNGSFTVNLPIGYSVKNMVMTISINRTSGAGGDQCYINSKGLSSFTFFTSTSGTGFQSFDFMAIGI